ncbi:fimbrial protein [Stenotrophomonas maltophilia]|uniref:fimbrial protein n=1 Tax=Stenotrophomonas maltophilia TaxID=40324 RepID=UPI0018D2E649|nr:fimbrial protein [Stenotrophomonas maltophilia]
MYVVPNVARALTLAGLTSFGFAAHAVCVPDVPSVTYAQTVPVRFVQEPDVLLHTASSSFITMHCDSAENLIVAPRLLGLRYVRDIDGYPAFEMGPDSPLVQLRLDATPLGDEEGAEPYPIDPVNSSTHWVYDNSGGSIFRFMLDFYSRGGAMRPQPQRASGSVQLQGTGGTGDFYFEIGYEFQGTTCALMDASPVLDPISADALDATGSGGAKDFTVQMDCGVPGRPVSLEIYDATDGSNMSDILAPAAGSSAQGVGLQVLHNGLPLPMGRVWAHTDSTGASERIPFTARYIRLAGEPLLAGEIIGQAVLVANYY